MRITIKAIVEFKNRILLLRDNNNNYDLPGGGVETRETLEQACIRELLEETSYKNFKIQKLLPSNYNYYVMKNPELKSNMSCYIVQLINLEKGTSVEKNTSEEWIYVTDLLSKFETKNTPRHIAMKNCIKDYLKQKTN